MKFVVCLVSDEICSKLVVASDWKEALKSTFPDVYEQANLNVEDKTPSEVREICEGLDMGISVLNTETGEHVI